MLHFRTTTPTSRPATPSDLSESFSESDVNVGYSYTGYHPVRLSAEGPSQAQGYILLVASVVFLLVGGWATLFSAFWPHTGNLVLDTLAADTHYKYFVVLLVPTTAYFVIANWTGWQYYRNS